MKDSLNRFTVARTAKQNTGKQRGRAAQQKITVQSTLFHCINISEIKTN